MGLFSSVVALAILLLMSTNNAAAQETAADLIPPASALGEGWIDIGPVPISDSPDPSFRDIAGTIYAGPEGMRAVVVVYQVAEGMTAIRTSWEIANEDFDSYRSRIDYEFDSSRENDIASSRPMPEGCADARRIYGTEEIGAGEFSVGLTLCAADPDVLVFVFVSGPMITSPASDASDEIVELVLAGSASTPTP